MISQQNAGGVQGMDKGTQAVITSLIHMMWADGVIEDYEREFMGAFLKEIQATPEEVAEIGKLMLVAPTEELNIREMLPEMSAREDAFQTMVAMAVVDGVLAKPERTLLDKIADHLEIPPERRLQLLQEVRQEVPDLKEE